MSAKDRHPIIFMLREIRKTNGVDIGDIASRMGREAETIRKYECGARAPTLKALARWADALGFELQLERKA